MNKYLPQTFEKKWTAYWEKKATYKASQGGKKKKMYVLDMFPYPSGAGLHVGHPRGYVASDIMARYYRMQGYDVLHPMGWDAFGLPAENAAIKAKRNPEEIVKENIATFKRQLKMLGFSYDWDREFTTTDPDYYKWTQWLFVQFYKMGLLYKKSTPVYYCPHCKTGLAQEEVLPNGTHERCGNPITTRELPQWIFRITTYADRLLELEGLNWPQGILEMQRNWIGKSEGAEVGFKLVGSEVIINVFTTRVDTLFGATTLILAPEHEVTKKILQGKIKVPTEVRARLGDYVKQARSKMDLQRTDLAKEKTGVSTELFALHPLTGEKIPIWLADYVLGQYGYGAVMSVPAHDERDYEFAKKYSLPIKEVIQPLFEKTTGPDATRRDEPYIKRKAVVCIVKHWSEDKYLCLEWKKADWRGFIVGGVDEAEDEVETGRREIYEETGYKNARFVRKIGGVIHSTFYQLVKKQNRWAVFQGTYYELENGDRVETTQDEKDLHEIKWLTKEEVDQFLPKKDDNDMQKLWLRLTGRAEIYTGEGILTNSDTFDGMASQQAMDAIVQELKKKNLGQKISQYKLRDWIFSRQRYWGEPIPMVFCKACFDNKISYWETESGKEFQKRHQNVSKAHKKLQKNLYGWFPVDQKSLPLTLPYIQSYEPTETAGSPLTQVKDWVNTTCPNCGSSAQRETDTMPNWAGSCWYFLRFADPHNTKEAWSQIEVAKWMPVDQYVGGAEHAVLHLLYSRFWVKALQDLGLIGFHEPFMSLRNQGMILGPDGRKMSKSWGNVINPDDVVNEYGADALRTYEMFMAPFNQEIPWSTSAFQGSYRFLKRVWDLFQKVADQTGGGQGKLLSSLNKTIVKVSRDIKEFKFNTAVSTMMEFLNEWEKTPQGLSSQESKKFLKLLAPFAPFTTEEIWQTVFREKISIHLSAWPEVDMSAIREETVTIPIQINGKVRATITINLSDKEDTVVAKVLKREKIASYLKGKKFETIYKENRIISFVTS